MTDRRALRLAGGARITDRPARGIWYANRPLCDGAVTQSEPRQERSIPWITPEPVETTVHGDQRKHGIPFPGTLVEPKERLIGLPKGCPDSSDWGGPDANRLADLRSQSRGGVSASENGVGHSCVARG